MFRKFINTIWHQAYEANIKNICRLLETDSAATALDVGCGDGQHSARFKKQIGSKYIAGIDGIKGRLTAAAKRNVHPIFYANLEKKWGIKDNSYDVVISNQVIEHIVDIDNFISEINRVLKPGGYCVISTENLSSWHNIISLILGHQDFSHHILKKSHIGTPLSPHYKEKTVTWSKDANSGFDDTAFPHIKILTYKSLIKAFETYGFKFEAGLASGYYPLFGTIAQFASKIDPYHSHFIVVKMRKV